MLLNTFPVPFQYLSLAICSNFTFRMYDMLPTSTLQIVPTGTNWHPMRRVVPTALGTLVPKPRVSFRLELCPYKKIIHGIGGYSNRMLAVGGG